MPQEAQGKFSNFPVGILLTDPSPTQADQWLIRSPGVSSGVPVVWTVSSFGAATPDHPDYSFSALTDHWAPGSPVPPPEFGGISSGGEVMPAVDDEGEMIMTIGNWYMLSITVKSQADGLDGSLLRTRTANSRNPAGDILSYYAIGSTGINPALVDTVRLEYSREQLRLQAPLPVATGDREIANHDFGVGVISIDPEERAGSMFPVRDCLYFTLTQAWVLLAGSTFELDNLPANASTIYVMTWDGSEWSDPAIAFSHSLLFPERDVGTVEIDALSVDRGSGTALSPDRTVFSLTRESDLPESGSVPESTFDQILVYQRGNSVNPTCPTTALIAADSISVSAKFGLKPRADFTPLGEPDDVGSTCGGDPKEPYQVGPIAGVATGQAPYGASDLGLSLIRTRLPFQGWVDGTTVPPNSGIVETLHMQVTGLEYQPHTWGFIVFYIDGPNGPEQWGSPYLIDAAASARNALEVPVSLPTSVLNVPLRIRAKCIGVDAAAPQTLVDLGESWVITIVL